MFDLSPEGANLWFDASNLVLLVGAVLVALGTFGTIRFSGIKEKFADERVAANEAETKRAIADSDSAKEGTAKAHERIAELSSQAEELRKGTAEANARAAEAQLALEKLKMPRSLTAAQQAEITRVASQFPGQKYCLAAIVGKEPVDLLKQIDAALQSAHWVRESPLPGSITTIIEIGRVAVSGGGFFQGVEIQFGAGAIGKPVQNVAESLSKALEAADIVSRMAAVAGPEYLGRLDTVQVTVTAKP